MKFISENIVFVASVALMISFFGGSQYFADRSDTDTLPLVPENTLSAVADPMTQTDTSVTAASLQQTNTATISTQTSPITSPTSTTTKTQAATPAPVLPPPHIIRHGDDGGFGDD